MTDKKVERPEQLPRRVSEVIGGVDDVENLVEVEEILDKDIIIRKIDFRKGKFGEYVILQFNTADDMTLKCVMSGGMVIIDKSHRLLAGNHLPVLAKITFNQKYYNLS